MSNPAMALATYKQVETTTFTDKGWILLKLYEGLLESVRMATKAILAGNMAEKGRHLTKAIAIVGELNAALDRNLQEELVANLEGLYLFIQQELTWANLKNEVSHLKNVEKVLNILYEAWKEAVKQERKAEKENE
ncbi:flagellar protein FliS [Thermosulfuriphilus ammonigenes]|nr:flagellar export chaperone FliS [Thermosulfuriphilus ammonigenes]MBA2849147.1 flagellar protein FliS [Thermosulfuriphilus ammonigenes]